MLKYGKSSPRWMEDLWKRCGELVERELLIKNIQFNEGEVLVKRFYKGRNPLIRGVSKYDKLFEGEEDITVMKFKKILEMNHNYRESKKSLVPMAIGLRDRVG